MKYRVLFHVGYGMYYTEWFETLEEAKDFVGGANRDRLDVRQIEDEEGDVI